LGYGPVSLEFSLYLTGEMMEKHGQVQRFLRPVFLALMIFGLMGQPLQAIGPGTGGSKIRVNDEDIGPYTLLVATSPLPVTAGQMSVWVRVTGKEDQKLRRDAVVTIKATPREGGETLSTQGTHQSAGNDFDYVGHLAVEQSGQWDVTITVVDDLGDAEVVFTESVTRGRSGSALLVLAIPFVIVAVAVGIFLWRRSAAA
jgi:hypothetical protein